MDLTILLILHPLTCDLQSWDAAGFPWIQRPDACQNLCICPCTEFRERVFLPQLWYFFTDEIFSSTQAIRELYATVNCTTISNIFIQWRSWFNQYVQFWGGEMVCGVSFVWFFGFFLSWYIYFWTDFLSSGKSIKSTWSCFPLLPFSSSICNIHFWLLCTNTVQYQP